MTEKSKESIRRGAERIINVAHPRAYKGDTANFASGTSISLT
nr:palindromic element RPE5 domain-containing protein [Rickettsia sp. TH2014]